MKRYTTESGNVKAHFDTLREAARFLSKEKSGKIIEHKIIYEFNGRFTKINYENISLSE